MEFNFKSKQITFERMLRLQVETDEVLSLATMTLLTTGLETIWANRVEKKATSMYEMRSESAVSIKRRSRNRQIREAGSSGKGLLLEQWPPHIYVGEPLLDPLI